MRTLQDNEKENVTGGFVCSRMRPHLPLNPFGPPALININTLPQGMQVVGRQ